MLAQHSPSFAPLLLLITVFVIAVIGASPSSCSSSSRCWLSFPALATCRSLKAPTRLKACHPSCSCAGTSTSSGSGSRSRGSGCSSCWAALPAPAATPGCKWCPLSRWARGRAALCCLRCRRSPCRCCARGMPPVLAGGRAGTCCRRSSSPCRCCTRAVPPVPVIRFITAAAAGSALGGPGRVVKIKVWLCGGYAACAAAAVPATVTPRLLILFICILPEELLRLLRWHQPLREVPGSGCVPLAGRYACSTPCCRCCSTRLRRVAADAAVAVVVAAAAIAAAVAAAADALIVHSDVDAEANSLRQHTAQRRTTHHGPAQHHPACQQCAAHNNNRRPVGSTHAIRLGEHTFPLATTLRLLAACGHFLLEATPAYD